MKFNNIYSCGPQGLTQFGTVLHLLPVGLPNCYRHLDLHKAAVFGLQLRSRTDPRRNKPNRASASAPALRGVLSWKRRTQLELRAKCLCQNDAWISDVAGQPLGLSLIPMLISHTSNDSHCPYDSNGSNVYTYKYGF